MHLYVSIEDPKDGQVQVGRYCKVWPIFKKQAQAEISRKKCDKIDD